MSKANCSLNTQNASAEHDAQDKRQRKVFYVFLLTVVTMLAEIIVGTWSGSMALLADGWHMGTHAAAFLITLFTYHYAKKNANNSDFNFGTGKVNFLGGFASAIALAIVALLMAAESIHRIFEPKSIHYTQAIAVACIGLVINIVSVFILHDSSHQHHHGHDHEHHHHGDQNLKAAYFHVMADALTSVLAIVALIIAQLYKWNWIDALVGIVGAVIILKWAQGLVITTSSVLLDKVPHAGSTASKLKTIEQDNDIQIEDFHIWRIAEDKLMLLASVKSEALSVEECKNIFSENFNGIQHLTIELKSI